MKSIIFWDVTPCSLSRCNRRFGGTYRLHLQGRRKFQQEPASKQVASKSYMIQFISCTENVISLHMNVVKMFLDPFDYEASFTP
jgi:hypothetical protein